MSVHESFQDNHYHQFIQTINELIASSNPNPEKPEEFIQTYLVDGLITPLILIDPQSKSEYLELAKQLLDTHNKDLRKAFQIDSLSKMLSLFMQGIRPDNETMIRILLMFIYYVWEKESDDKAKLDTVDPGTFIHKDELLDFNLICQQIIAGGEFLPEALSNIDSNSFAKAETDLSQNLGYTFPIQCNLISLYLNAEAIKEIRTNFPELEKICEFALQGLKDRYESVRRILKNPSMSIEEAMELGEFSILTNSTFSTFFLFVAAQNEKYRSELLANQDLAITCIRESSFIIRALNDAGPALEYGKDSEMVIDRLNELRRDIGDDLAPRAFFAQLSKVGDKEDLDLFSRLIKDSLENEYNMVFNSGYDNTAESSEKHWGPFFDNLRKLHAKYQEVKHSLKHNLSTLKQSDQMSVQKMAHFIAFNEALYSIYMGDYDATAEIIIKTISSEWLTIGSSREG